MPKLVRSLSIVQFFGQMALEEIKTGNVNDWIAEMQTAKVGAEDDSQYVELHFRRLRQIGTLSKTMSKRGKCLSIL